VPAIFLYLYRFQKRVKPAILANATRIILLHNHHSGDPSPSQDDILLTDRLKEAGEVLGINVIDHVNN
jgi:DNA repair protein RadC